MQDILINNENVAALNYLSTKYEISDLYEKTNEYISNHQTELILPILLTHCKNKDFDSSTYENFISTNLLDYINDELLLDLNVSIMNHILIQYQSKSKSVDEEQKNNEIIDFLFKYLDKHGHEASVLFNNIDFGDCNTEYVDQLINNYFPIFDFNFINSSLLKALIDANKEIKNIKEENKNLKYEISPMTRIAKSRENYSFLKKPLGIITLNGLLSIMHNVNDNDNRKGLLFSEFIAKFMKNGIDFVNKMNLPSILSQDEFNYYTTLANFIQNNISIFENKENSFNDKIKLFSQQMNSNLHEINPNKILKPLAIIIDKILNNEELVLIALENKEKFNELNILSEDLKVITSKLQGFIEKMKNKQTSE